MKHKETKTLNTKIKPDLKSSVMENIKTGKVTMKPKAYFILGSLFLGGGLAVIFLLALIFLSASAFHLRTQNPIGFLRYGSIGGPAFIHVFPFKLLALSMLGIVGGLWLLKKYDISYKKSFMGISLALVGALITIAFAVDRFGMSEKLQRAKTLAPLYKQQFIQDQMVMGEVVSASDSALVIKDPRTNQDVQVVWDERTILPEGSSFEVGDHVGAVGEFEDGVFEAEGIHESGMRWKSNPPPRLFDDSNSTMMPRNRQRYK